MKKLKSFKNLTAPASQNFDLHHLKSFQVPREGKVHQMVIDDTCLLL